MLIFACTTYSMNQAQKDTLLQELFDHVTESIIVIDAAGVIKMANPATEKLFGFTVEELSGQTIEYMIPERYAKHHVSNRENYNKHPHSRAMGIGLDLYAKKKDGSEFPVEISLSPFESDGQKFTIAFIIDITKRKLAEQEIIQKQQELKTINEKLESKVQDRTKVLEEALTEIERSRTELKEALEKEKELNELKSRFLSMASHEFRTPLTTILSSASIIPEYALTEQQDKRLKHVQRIQSGVNHLNDILTDFLSLSKIEEGKIAASYVEANVKELIESIIHEMKDNCKDGQQISYTHTGKESIISDPKLIRNIVINLLSNAIKFSGDCKEIHVSTTVDSKHIRIQVKDEGIGISKEDKEHLFERFFRGHNAINIKGTGLGLNIVTKYVELMNGFIEMESELNKGTMFKITIPISKSNT